MKRSDTWSDAKIRVLSASYERKSKKNIEELQRTLEEVRIDAESEVVEEASADSIVSHSADAALVFIPFRIRGDQLLGPFDGQLEPLLSRLPIVALVLASEDIDLDAEPEKGKAGEMASALDTLTDAKKNAEHAEKEAAEAVERTEKKVSKLQDAAAAADEETKVRIKTEVVEAKEHADKAARRAAKAHAKAENATREAEAVGVKPPDEKDTASEPSDS